MTRFLAFTNLNQAEIFKPRLKNQQILKINKPLAFVGDLAPVGTWISGFSSSAGLDSEGMATLLEIYELPTKLAVVWAIFFTLTWTLHHYRFLPRVQNFCRDGSTSGR